MEQEEPQQAHARQPETAPETVERKAGHCAAFRLGGRARKARRRVGRLSASLAQARKGGREARTKEEADHVEQRLCCAPLEGPKLSSFAVL